MQQSFGVFEARGNRGAVERHRRGTRSCADGEMVWSVHASQLRNAFACPLDLERIAAQCAFARELERPRRGSVGLQRRIDACRQQRIAITDDPFVDVDRTERGTRVAGGVVEVPIGVASRIALKQHVRAGQHDDVWRHPQQRRNAEAENHPRERGHWLRFRPFRIAEDDVVDGNECRRTPIDVDVADRHGSLQPGAGDRCDWTANPIPRKECNEQYEDRQNAQAPDGVAAYPASGELHDVSAHRPSDQVSVRQAKPAHASVGGNDAA